MHPITLAVDPEAIQKQTSVLWIAVEKKQSILLLRNELINYF